MAVYVVIFLILFLFRKSDSKILFFLIFLGLTIVLGLREYYVGEDTERYMNYYNSLSEGYMEFLWNRLSRLSQSLGFSAYAFNLLIAFLSMLFVSIECFKRTEYPVRALFFYYAMGFYLLMFNGMRQFFALSICLMAMGLITDKKYFGSVALILLASQFHTSALVCLALLLVRFYDFSKSKIVLITITALILGLALPQELFLGVTGKYAHDVDTYGFRTLSNTLSYAAVMNTFFFLILSKLKRDDLDDIWIRFYCMSMLVFNVLVKLVIGPRIMYYFTVAQVIAIARLLQHKKNDYLKLYCYLFAIADFVRYMLPEMAKAGERGSLVPYAINLSLFGQ